MTPPTSKTSPLEFTSLDAIDSTYEALRKGFATRKSKSIAWRKDQLSQLAHLLNDNRERIAQATHADLGRPPFESDVLDTSATLKEAVVAYHNVEKWAKPTKLPFDLTATPMRPVIRKEPKGVVLIIAPFNYPTFLALGPLAGAIAAGCACVVKPSELAPNTAALFAEIIPKYLDPDMYAVVNGGAKETSRLLELRWDHILYTGSERIARIVSMAAAKHLTPITLELGGKSPAFIDSKCNLPSTARKLMWGKMSNAGQTCVAPDYAFVPREFQDEFVAELKKVHDEFYPEGPAQSDSFARIISSNHFERVRGLVEKTNGKVIVGGVEDADATTKYLPPTVVSDVRPGDSLLSEEIFGPVLPIVPVDSIEEAIRYVNEHEHPLALYVFSQDSKFKNKVFDNTQSGSAVANESILQIGVEGLPFGGVGTSGHGNHTGKYGFDTFTHERSSLDAPTWLDILMSNRYPPYNAKKLARLMPGLWPSLPPRVGASVPIWKRARKLVFAAVVVLWSFVAARRWYAH